MSRGIVLGGVQAAVTAEVRKGSKVREAAAMVCMVPLVSVDGIMF